MNEVFFIDVKLIFFINDIFVLDFIVLSEDVILFFDI